jgi:hypothetical protein
MKPDVNGVSCLGNPTGFNLANQIKGVAAKVMQLQNKANIQAMDIILARWCNISSYYR